jgi:regulatory protein
VTRGATGRDAFAAALALLTGRALTTGELAARLQRRGHDEAAVAAACRRAADLGYVDDQRTALAWAESAARTRGLGPRRVREGLARRLLAPEIVEEATGAAFAGGAEADLAREALARWLRARGARAAERRPAAYAHLLRRGFSAAAARAALFNDREIL